MKKTPIPFVDSNFIYIDSFVMNQHHPTIVDTGAMMGYAKSDIVDQFKLLDNVDDYNPN